LQQFEKEAAELMLFTLQTMLKLPAGRFDFVQNFDLISLT
jgi:hypothetical protein